MGSDLNLLDFRKMHSLPDDRTMKDLSKVPNGSQIQQPVLKAQDWSLGLSVLKAQNMWIRAKMDQLDSVSVQEHFQNERCSVPLIHKLSVTALTLLNAPKRRRRETAPEL